jgi:uncharacterized Tic20 family protein
MEQQDLGYEIGYYIGSYLPFIVIASAMIVVWRMGKRKKRRIEEEGKE